MATIPTMGRSPMHRPTDAAEIRTILFWVTSFALVIIAVIGFARARVNRISARTDAIISEANASIPAPEKRYAVPNPPALGPATTTLPREAPIPTTIPQRTIAPIAPREIPAAIPQQRAPNMTAPSGTVEMTLPQQTIEPVPIPDGTEATVNPQQDIGTTMNQEPLPSDVPLQEPSTVPAIPPPQ